MSDSLDWLTDRQRDGGIDRLRLPTDVPGTLWLCGKHAISTRFGSGAWDTVVCLVERHELDDRYPDYLAWLDAAGDSAIWHEIHDLHAPPAVEMTSLVERIVERLRAGERLVMHCAAGKGRTGTTAACVLIEFGASIDDALQRVAADRPGAGPEVGAQRDLVATFGAARG